MGYKNLPREYKVFKGIALSFSLFVCTLASKATSLSFVTLSPDTSSASIDSALADDGIVSLVPFQEQYQLWDTTRIHPYRFDLTKMEDTVTLVLADAHDCGSRCPVPGYVTSNFGPRTRTRYHYGIDLKLNIGDTVASAFDGIVRISHYSPSYGNCVVIRHYNGLETLYGHLSKRNVHVGQAVRSGEMIGYGGNTGRSSGPHLHFEVRYKGQAIDPNQVFTFTDSTYSLRSDTLTISRENFSYLTKRKYGKRSKRYARGRSAKYRNTYVVKSGDNLWKISKKSGVSVARLKKLNRMKANSTVRKGQKLRIR